MSEQQDLRIAGISLDCPDPALLAAFYGKVLGGRTLWTKADSAGVEASGVVLIAQRVSDYVPPTWPGTSVVHLDLAAGLDLEASVAFAVASGAKKAAYQPDPSRSPVVGRGHGDDRRLDRRRAARPAMCRDDDGRGLRRPTGHRLGVPHAEPPRRAPTPCAKSVRCFPTDSISTPRCNCPWLDGPDRRAGPAGLPCSSPPRRTTGQRSPCGDRTRPICRPR